MGGGGQGRFSLQYSSPCLVLSSPPLLPTLSLFLRNSIHPQAFRLLGVPPPNLYKPRGMSLIILGVEAGRGGGGVMEGNEQLFLPCVATI